jgi:hypothetical protein
MKLDRLGIKRLAVVVGLAAVAAATGASGAIAQQGSGEKPHVVVAETRQVSAVVEDIDYQTRMVTLKRADGKEFTFRVDERARRFGEVKKGDHVRVTYYASASILVRKPEGETGVSQAEKVELAPKGHGPGGVIATTTSAVATVTDIDYKKRIAKVQRPDGEIVTVHATPEMKRFNEVKKGDQVVIEVTEAIAVSVHK